MKNKLLMLIGTFIISLTLFTCKVSADDGFTCKYYDAETDNLKLIVNNIKAYNQFEINIYDSPIIMDTEPKGELEHWYQKGPYVFFEPSDNGQYWYQGYITNAGKLAYISLYPGASVFENATESQPDDAEKCPKVLRYKIYTSGVEKSYIRVHYDDLDIDPMEPAHINEYEYNQTIFDTLKKTKDVIGNYLTNFKGPESEGYLISEKYRGTPVDELLDKYNCLTYSSYITAIENTATMSGCENNQTFTRLYQDLKDKCDYFRETQSYSQDGSTRAKDCSKACSNFKDDISDICKLSSDSGCNSLGPKIIKWIYKVIKWVRYIIPALIVILVILEYVKALASEDEKAMKDATSHMFLRLVIAALIFILPFILDFVLNIFNITELKVDNLFCQK